MIDMKNSNMPVSPIFGSNGRIQPFTDDQGFSSMATGLTKREHFAGLAMQAWINHHGAKGGYSYNDVEMAESAIHSADALLKELANNEK